MTKSRCFKIVTVFSLLLNFVLLGITFGYTGHDLVAQSAPDRRLDLRAFIAVLPEERRGSFENTVLNFEHESVELHQQLLIERKKTAALIEAKPFDKIAYMAQVNVMIQMMDQMKQKTALIIGEIAAQASDGERVRLADMLLNYKKHQVSY